MIPGARSARRGAATRGSSESGRQGPNRFPDITAARASPARPPDPGTPASIFRPGSVAAQTCWAEAVRGSDRADLRLKGLQVDLVAVQSALSSPARIPAVNCVHWAEVSTRMGPLRSLESRTATIPGRLSATSTQAPPLLL